MTVLKRFMCRFCHSQLGERFDGITKNYSPKYSENEKNLLSDSRGNARRSGTHAALAIAGIVLQKDFDVIYVSSPDFFGKLENARFDSSEDAETLLRTASAATTVG